MKKFISKILVLAMLISVLPKVSFAEEEKAKTEAVNKTEEKTEKTSEKEAKVRGKREVNLTGDPLTYKVFIKVKSATPGKEVPQEIKDNYDWEMDDAPSGYIVYLNKIDSQQVGNGTWVLDHWELEKSDGTKLTVKDKVKVEDEDIHLFAVLKYEEGEAYNVYYSFESDDDGSGDNLPDVVKKLLPKDKIGVKVGTIINLPKFEDVKVDSGKWMFKGWTVSSFITEGELTKDSFEVQSGSDYTVTGKWQFVEDGDFEYRLYYSFESVTDGKTLPLEVFTQIPEDVRGNNGTKITLPVFNNVEVAEGTWKPVRWSEMDSYGFRNKIIGDRYTIHQDGSLILSWKFILKGEVEKFDVRYSFESITEGKELPKEVFTQIPRDEVAELNSKLTLPKFEDVKVDGGTWKAVKWTKRVNGGTSEVIGNEATIKDDTDFILAWEFVEDKKPENPQKPNPQKATKLPKTNAESAFSYVLLALAGIGGAYISKKKDNE